MARRVGEAPARPADEEVQAEPTTLVRRASRAAASFPVRAGVIYLAIAALLFFVVGASLVFLPFTDRFARPTFYRRQPWFDGWFRFDGGWYYQIAERGYWTFDPDGQSPVAYFPAYPLLMRAGRSLFGNVVTAGIMVTVASGLAAATLFAVWARDRLPSRAAWVGLLAFLLYPFSYYLYGAVYADALFVASMLGAFVLLDRDRPVLAGLVAAVGTAARPVGAVVVLAFVIRAIERRGGIRRLRWKDAGVLLACLGVGGFCLYTWARFGTPFAFVEAQRGWDQTPGPQTWFKTEFLDGLELFSGTLRDKVAYLSHPVFTLGALLLVPSVVRRFGWGYGAYVLLVVGVSAVSTKNFFGMGRYVLAAFPCFAAAGALLARRRLIAPVVLGASGVLMVAGASFFARGFYHS